MPKPVRIQRKRTPGWKMPANTIYVGRPTRWGNPARVGMWKGFTRADAVEAFRCWMRRDLSYRSWENIHGKPPATEEITRALRGKNLACFCPLDQPCHADVLLELANG